MAELWRKSLELTRAQFQSLADAGVRVECLLTESLIPAQPPQTNSPGQPPGYGHQNILWFDSFPYREFGFELDEQGCVRFGTQAFVDAARKPIANSAGQPVAVRLGAGRSIKLLGDREWIRRGLFIRLQSAAEDAGAVLDGIPADVLSRLPSETLRTSARVSRWLLVLFDLAWQEVPGSPLRVKVEPSAWVRDCSVPLRSLPGLRTRTADHTDWLNSIFGAISDPPSHWYSALADAVAASVYAIDILLNSSGADRHPTKPAAETSKGEGTNADQWSPTLPPELRGAPLVNLCLTTPPPITENLVRTADGRFFSVWWNSSTALYRWSPVTEDYARRAAEPVASYCGKTDWRELFNSAPAGQTREVEADGSAPADRREPHDGNAGKSARRKANKAKRKRGRRVDPMTIQRADFAKPLREQEYTWKDIYAAYRSKYPRDIEASADSIRLAFDRQNLERE